MATTTEQDSPPPVNGTPTPEPQRTGDASAPEATDDFAGEELTENDALKLLGKQFRQLAEYFSYYVSAKIDGVKLSLRTAVLWVVLAALGFVAVGGLIVAASCYVLSGFAEGLSVLFNDRAWAGNIMAGLLLLTGLGFGLYFTFVKGKRASLKRRAHKYETRRARQQADFGCDVSKRAKGGPSDGK